jgi:hypothetical protein
MNTFSLNPKIVDQINKSGLQNVSGKVEEFLLLLIEASIEGERKCISDIKNGVKGKENKSAE